MRAFVLSVFASIHVEPKHCGERTQEKRVFDDFVTTTLGHDSHVLW
jgi:hypothetical protein